MSRIIFHLVAAQDFDACRAQGQYRPPSLEREGFIHCAPDEAVTLQVAGAYFSQVEAPVLVLAIDVDLLHSRCVDEAPAPPDGRPRAHHGAGRLFPHVYGPINEDAIVGVGVLQREAGAFAWPSWFEPLSAR